MQRSTPSNSRYFFLVVALFFCLLFIFGRSSMGNSRNNRVKQHTAPTLSALPLPPQERLHVTLKKVTDGDTIKVISADGTDFDGVLRVRLRYIDTPEKAQPFGPEATDYLRDLLNGSYKLSVSFDEYDMYGRALGVVYYGRRNVNRLLLENGFAWCYRNQCPRSYSKPLKKAQQEGKGLWSQPNPQSPWDYRKERRMSRKRKNEL